MAAPRDYNRRTDNRTGRGYANTYIDGNVVRHLQTVPKQPQRRPREEVRRNTRRNRERALRMNLPYVIFLAAASIATVWVCVNFLRLQAEGITYRSEIAVLESRLSSMKLANDNAYENAVSSVKLEEVKYIAINELGMSYAEEGQIITYNDREGDYIRQYAEIPVK